MTHEFLLHFHRSSGLVQPRTIRVTERVPAECAIPPSCDPSSFVDQQSSPVRCGLVLSAPNPRVGSARRTGYDATARRAKMPFLNLRGVIRPVRIWIGKQPTLLRWYGLFAPVQNNLCQGQVQRNIVLGVFGFDIVHSTAHKAALNEELILIKIEVVPLKRRDLAYAKTEALCDVNHRATRLAQCRYDEFELVHSQNHGALPALRSAFHANQCDGVPMLADELPAGCTLEHQVHDTPNMSLRLGCHWEILQPVLHRHRADSVHEVVAPARFEVVDDIGTIRLRSGVPFGRRKRCFAVPAGSNVQRSQTLVSRLVDTTKTPIERHVKVKSGADPFSPHWHGYFEDRKRLKLNSKHR